MLWGWTERRSMLTQPHTCSLAQSRRRPDRPMPWLGAQHVAHARRKAFFVFCEPPAKGLGTDMSSDARGRVRAFYSSPATARIEAPPKLELGPTQPHKLHHNMTWAGNSSLSSRFTHIARNPFTCISSFPVRLPFFGPPIHTRRCRVGNCLVSYTT